MSDCEKKPVCTDCSHGAVCILWRTMLDAPSSFGWMVKHDNNRIGVEIIRTKMAEIAEICDYYEEKPDA